MKKKYAIIILIISAVFLFGTVGILVSMTQIDKKTENNTTYYSATVSKVQVTDTGRGSYIEIQIEEYKSNLQISTNVSKNMNIDDIRDLQSGQKIFFRIENVKNNQMYQVEFVNIVSLKTEDKDIFTLDDYNNYIRKSAYPARTAGLIIALLLLLAVVLSILSIKRKGTKPK